MRDVGLLRSSEGAIERIRGSVIGDDVAATGRGAASNTRHGLRRRRALAELVGGRGCGVKPGCVHVDERLHCRVYPRGVACCE